MYVHYTLVRYFYTPILSLQMMKTYTRHLTQVNGGKNGESQVR